MDDNASSEVTVEPYTAADYDSLLAMSERGVREGVVLVSTRKPGQSWSKPRVAHRYGPRPRRVAPPVAAPIVRTATRPRERRAASRARGARAPNNDGSEPSLASRGHVGARDEHVSALTTTAPPAALCQWHAGCDQPHSGHPNKDGLLLCPRHVNTARQQRLYNKRRDERRANPFRQLGELVADAVECIDHRGQLTGEDALELRLRGEWLVIDAAVELLRLRRVEWHDLPEPVRAVLRAAA